MNRITARAMAGIVAIGIALAGSAASGAPGAGKATVTLEPETKPPAEAAAPAAAAPVPAPAPTLPATPAPVMPAAPTGDEVGRQLQRVENLLAGVDDTGQPCVEAGLQQNVRTQLNRIGRMIDDKNYRDAVQGCDNMLATPCSAGFRKAIKELSALLTAAAKAEQTRGLAEARTFLANLPAACAKAKTQEELQALQEQLQQLQADLGRPSSSGGENPAASMLRDSLYSARDGMREWMALKAAEDAGDDIKVYEILSRLSSAGSLGARGSPEIAKRLEALQAGMLERVDKAIMATRDALLKATTAKEVQTLSSSFSRQAERLGRMTNNDNYAAQQVNSLRNALSYWGRLLAAEERGDVQQALQTLTELEIEGSGRQDSQLQAVVAVKRETLVRRALTQPPKADDPLIKLVADEVAKADTLEKLGDLRRRLATAQSPYASYSRFGTAGAGEVPALLGDIQALENLQAAVQARQFTQALLGYGLSGSGMHRWKPLVNQYYNQLRIKAVSDLFQLPELELGAGQTVDQALLQAADKAVAARQWDRVARCLDAYRISTFANQPAPTFLLDQIAACRAFLAAGNFEKAGDLERAAASYLLVLNAPPERTPLADALKEIARLRKEHPEVLEHLRGQPLAGPAPIPPAGGVAQPGLGAGNPAMPPGTRGTPTP